MLSDLKLKSLKDWANEASRDEQIWASGFLAGLSSKDNDLSEKTQNLVPIKIKPTIIYGTETGNSKKLAVQLQTIFKKNKIQSKVVDAFQYSLDKIEKEDFLIVIMSTQGEGDPPQNAQKFFDNLHNLQVNLSATKFAVLSLGDSSYPLFCKAGEDIDKQLERLKAVRNIAYQSADVDYQPVADAWFQEVLKSIQSETKSAEPKTLAVPNVSNAKKTYVGKINHRVVLNDIGSNKQTYHIEFISEDEIAYEPGDAVGFYPTNSDQSILELYELLDFNEDLNLFRKINFKGLSKKSLENIGQLFQIEIKEDRADLSDILKKYSTRKKINSSDLLAILYPISPRLYSISSAREAHDGELHVTVTLDTFTIKENKKLGLGSSFLADFPLDQEIEFYIHTNKHFRLPSEDKDVIMIGPGTGIAPFRSFLAHRDATAADGKNWLFFGEQHFVSDFYYQTEIQEWLATGVLTKLDTAFSRDQKQKIYVQDRIKEQAKTFVNWLDNGAFLYLCGQKEPMSADVEYTIQNILIEEKGLSQQEALFYLENLEAEGRFLKDVY